MRSRSIENSAAWCRELAARCRAGLKRFDRRPENSEDPDDDESELSQAYIAKRITVMVASFPNANPSSPEGYMQMLVEHVSAIEDLTEVELEGACREIVETQKFAPAISEVLEVINKHTDKWSTRRLAIRYVEQDLHQAMKRAVEREQKEQKEAHERAIQCSKNALRSWTRDVQRLAEEIEKVKAEAKAIAEAAETKIAALMQRRAEVERRESEEMRTLEALTAAQEEDR
jgi:hypothetical protein